MAVTGAVADTDVAVKPMARGRVALVLIALAMGGFAIGVTEFAQAFLEVVPDLGAAAVGMTLRLRRCGTEENVPLDGVVGLFDHVLQVASSLRCVYGFGAAPS